jgi:hypothetical protein
MIKILKNEKGYSLPNGDIGIYHLRDWIEVFPSAEKFEWNRWNFFHLEYISKNPWLAAKKLHIEVEPLMEATAYRCPIMRETYTACVPYGIATKHEQLETYSKHAPPHCRAMLLDKEWIKKHVVKWKGGIWHTLIMGSGYKEPILPSDGSNSKMLSAVKLDNGDYMLVWHFVWYNK